jgi:excisionase family DNA binding protein
MPARIDPEPMFVTPTQAALMLGVSVTTVSRMLNAGLLPCVRLGSKRLIPVAVFEELRDTAIRNFKQSPPREPLRHR